jgi:hypothetical protein
LTCNLLGHLRESPLKPLFGGGEEIGLGLLGHGVP